MAFEILKPTFTQTDLDALQDRVAVSLRLATDLDMWGTLQELMRSDKVADIYRLGVTPTEFAVLNDDYATSLADKDAPFGAERKRFLGPLLGMEPNTEKLGNARYIQVATDTMAVVHTLSGRQDVKITSSKLDFATVEPNDSQQIPMAVSWHIDHFMDHTLLADWYMQENNKLLVHQLGMLMNGDNGDLNTWVINDASPLVLERWKTAVRADWPNRRARHNQKILFRGLRPYIRSYQLNGNSLAFYFPAGTLHRGAVNTAPAPVLREHAQLMFG